MKRNLQIIDYADEVIAFWDGMSHGTRFVIESSLYEIVSPSVFAVVGTHLPIISVFPLLPHPQKIDAKTNTHSTRHITLTFI